MEGRKEATKSTTTGSSVFFDPTPYLESCHDCGRSKYKITPTITRSISSPVTFPAPPATAATAPFYFPRSENVSLPTAAAATTPCCEVPVMAASQAVQGTDPLPIAIPNATPKRKLFCDKATETSTDGQRVAKRLSPSLHSLVEHTEVLKKLKRCSKELRTVVYELDEAIEEYQTILNRKEEERPHSHQFNGQPAVPSDGGNLF